MLLASPASLGDLGAFVLQKQTQAVESELQSLKMAAMDEAKYLQDGRVGERATLVMRPTLPSSNRTSGFPGIRLS
jgi:hypothetical protein